jgi:TetR/AcrR family transcriptional regulator, acrAB operon repressor
MRRTRAAASETRHRILDAAEQVFVARGVAATTLANIASAAGVTRGAIYGHFRNKDDLFTAMVERVMQPATALIDAVENAREPDPLGHMRRLFVASLHDMTRNPQAWRGLNVVLTKCELVDESGSLLERYRATGYVLRKRLQGALRNAIGRGQLPPELDVEFATVLLVALWTGVLREWLIDPEAMALEKDAERIADSWLDILRHSPTCLAGN